MSSAELAELCAEARLFVDPMAPIGREIARRPSRSASLGTRGPDPSLRDRIARAVLITVAAPDRVLLLVRQTEGVTRGSMFLQRRNSIVRVAPAEGRWLLSAPSSRAEFAEGICRTLEITETQTLQPTATEWLPISAAAALQREVARPVGAPVRGARGPGSPPPTAEREPDAPPLSEVIAALSAGATTATSDDTLDLVETWLSELAGDLEIESTRLYAVEIPDLERSVAPRRVLVTGRGHWPAGRVVSSWE